MIIDIIVILSGYERFEKIKIKKNYYLKKLIF